MSILLYFNNMVYNSFIIIKYSLILFFVNCDLHNERCIQRELCNYILYKLYTLYSNTVQFAMCTKKPVHIARCTIPDFVCNIYIPTLQFISKLH